MAIREFVCALPLLPFCAAYDAGFASGRATRQAAVDAGTRLDNIQRAAGEARESFVSDVGDAGEGLLDAASRPLAQVASTAMWTTIGLIAIAVIALFALVFYFFR